MINIRGIQLPPGSIVTLLPTRQLKEPPFPLIVCINEEPTPFCEGVFFSGCFCFISIGENDIISVHGRKDFGVRTAGREEEKKGWTVATSEVGMCCRARRGPRKGGVASSLDYSGQGHMWVWAAHGITGIFSLVGEAGAESPPRSFFSVSSSFKTWEFRPHMRRRLSPKEATDTTIFRMQITVNRMQNARNKFIIMLRFSLHLSVFQSELSVNRTGLK